MFTKIALAALALMTVACNVETAEPEVCVEQENQTVNENICHGEFSVYTPDFSADQLVSFIKAETEFNSFFGKKLLHFTFTGEKQTSCQAQNKDLSSEGFDGKYTFAKGMLYLDMQVLHVSEKSLINVIQHESFHSFSAIHRCGSIMQASGYHTFSEVDRQQALDLGLL